MKKIPEGLIHMLKYGFLICLMILTGLSAGYAQDRMSGQWTAELRSQSVDNDIYLSIYRRSRNGFGRSQSSNNFSTARCASVLLPSCPLAAAKTMYE